MLRPTPSAPHTRYFTPLTAYVTDIWASARLGPGLFVRTFRIKRINRMDLAACWGNKLTLERLLWRCEPGLELLCLWRSFATAPLQSLNRLLMPLLYIFH
jgi:hypothetical protein